MGATSWYEDVSSSTAELQTFPKHPKKAAHASSKHLPGNLAPAHVPKRLPCSRHCVGPKWWGFVHSPPGWVKLRLFSPWWKSRSGIAKPPKTKFWKWNPPKKKNGNRFTISTSSENVQRIWGSLIPSGWYQKPPLHGPKSVFLFPTFYHGFGRVSNMNRGWDWASSQLFTIQFVQSLVMWYIPWYIIKSFKT